MNLRGLIAHWSLSRRSDLPLSRFFISTAVVSVMAVAVIAMTLLRDLSIAYRFGISDEIDAFLVALLVPTLAVQVIGVALGTAVVPRLLAIKQDGELASQTFVRHVISASMLVLVASCLSLILIAEPTMKVLAGGFAPEKAALAHRLYIWLLLSIPLQGWSTLMGTIANARNRFAAVAFAPALRPATTALLIITIPRSDPMLLVWGYIAGSVLEVGLVAWVARRSGIPLGPARPGLGTVRALQGFGPTSVASIVMAVSAFTTQYLASLLAPGSLTALSYGGKLISLAIAVCVAPIGITTLPLFSEMVSAKRWSALSKGLLHGSAILLTLGTVAGLVCAVFSRPLVSLLFERGEFTSADVDLVASVQQFLALQLPFYCAGILLVRALAALQMNRAILLVAVANAITNLAVSLSLMALMGVIGLALGVSVGYIVGASLAGWLVFSNVTKQRFCSSDARGK